MKRIEFHWKLDPVAVAALVLSVVAAVGQFVAWVHGPSVRLIVPDRVALYSDTLPDGTVMVRIAAPMSYANVAQAAFGDLVLKERVKLSAGIVTQQRWNSFGEIKRGAITATAPSAVQPLPGQSAVAHFTLFTPVPVECPQNATNCNPKQDYVTPEELNQQLGKIDRLRFTFEIELIEGGTLSKSCDVPLTKLVKDEVEKLRGSMVYAVCRATD